MSFTYDASGIAVDSSDSISAVRWLMQDTTSATAEISDEEIEALYDATSAAESQAIRNLRTALAAAQALHRRYAKQATFSSGGSSFQLGARAEAWATVVDDLDRQLADAVMQALGMQPGILVFGRGPAYDDGSGTW